MGAFIVLQFAKPAKGEPVRLHLQCYDTYAEALEVYNRIKDDPVNDAEYIQTSVEGPTGEILELHKNYRWIRMYTL